MKVYWRLKDVPELQNLSRGERRRVLRNSFFWYGYRMWQFWVGQLAIIVFAIIGDLLAVVLRYGYGFPYAVCYPAGLVVGLMGCAIFAYYYTVVVERLRPRFREYQAAHPPAN